MIVDYKGKTATPVARWVKDGKLQLGLYVLAARELHRRGELDAVAGRRPLPAAGRRRAHGRAVRCSKAPTPAATSSAPTGSPPEALDAVLAEVLAAAESAVAEMRAGALEPRPDSCAWDGSGCSYPTICRCEAA